MLNMTTPPAVRQQVPVRFAAWRQAAISVPPYLAKKVGVEGTPALRTAVEDDCGIAGLGTESLLLEFGADYHVDLLQVDFTSFISPEPGAVDGWLFFPKGLRLLGCWLGQALVALVGWPVSTLRARKTWAVPTPSLWFPARFPSGKRPLWEVLAVGDFVAAAARGRFAKREQVRFIVNTPNLPTHHWAA